MRMKNPFSYTGIVTGDAFCNRQTEQTDLLKFIKGPQNVLLYSHRRYGKSSLIYQLFKRVQRQRPPIDTLYVELYGTLSEKEFVSAILASLNQIESRLEKLVNRVKGVLRTVKLGVSIDPVTGSPGVSVSFDTGYDEGMLGDVLGLLGRFSEKRKLMVVFDEFQEIAGYRQEGFEKRLRAIIQQHGNISYFFCGSQRHILTEIFSGQNRAFYKLAQSYPIDKIETRYYVPWARKLFKKGGKKIKAEIIEEIVSRCENHPMYVQQFLFYLWENKKTALSTEAVDRIELKILQSSHNEFLNLWESLTLNQKKTLKLIIYTGGKDMFYANALQAVDLYAGSQVTRSLDKLMRDDVVLKNADYKIQDMMFKKWIQTFLWK
jgi:AAA+ ATPase superfamily predicted ATPase